MNYIYSALLLHSAGKEINEENVKKVIEATGEKADDAMVKALVTSVEGVNIDEVIEKAAAPVTVAAPVANEQKSESKKEEKTEENQEKKAEEAAEGLGALFG